MTLDPDYGITQADRDPAIGQTCATHRAPSMTADSPRTGVISTPQPPVLTVEVQRDRIVRPTNAAVVVEIHPAVGKRQDPTDPERRRAQLTVDLTRPLSAKIQGMESLGFHTNPLLHHIEMIVVPLEVVPPDVRPLRTNRPRVIRPATKPRERTGLVTATTNPKLAIVHARTLAIETPGHDTTTDVSLYLHLTIAIIPVVTGIAVMTTKMTPAALRAEQVTIITLTLPTPSVRNVQHIYSLRSNPRPSEGTGFVSWVTIHSPD